MKIDFGKENNKLATRLETKYDVWNKLAHFTDISEDEFSETLINMKSISRSLKMDDLEAELTLLQEIKQPVQVSLASPHSNELLPWFRVVTPHMDIKLSSFPEMGVYFSEK